MKKIGITLLAVILNLGVISCNSNAAENSTERDNGNKSAVEVKAEGIVVHLSEESFKALVWDYDKNPDSWEYVGELPAVIDFYADWCGPCKKVAPIMDKLAADYNGQLIIYKVNTDENRELSSVFGIRSIPSVMFIPQQGKPAMQVGAMQESQYKDIIEDFVLGKKDLQKQ